MGYLRSHPRSSRSRRLNGLARLPQRARAAAEEIHRSVYHSPVAFNDRAITQAARIIQRHMRVDVPAKGEQRG